MRRAESTAEPRAISYKPHQPPAPKPGGGLAARLRTATRAASEDTSLTASFYVASPTAGTEINRILALPQRTWSESEALALARKWTAVFRRPGSTMELRPVQGVALEEIHLYGGMLGPIPVGEGKTLIAMLAFMVLDAKSGLLMLPAQLKNSLLQLTYPVLAANFRVPNITGGPVLYPDVKCGVDVVAYSQVSSKTQSRILDERRPEAVVCDEAHTYGNEDTSRTMRFERMCEKNPTAHYIFLSGSLIDPKDHTKAGRLGRLALRSGSPYPLDDRELRAFADVVDVSERPAPPGPYERMCEGAESVREAFGRRLLQTPGVVPGYSKRLPNALELHCRSPKIPAEFSKTLAHVRKTWALPSGEALVDEDGLELEDALGFHRIMRQLAAGFFYRLNPPAPRYWLDARRGYHSYVRNYLARHARPDMDSPGLVESALVDGKLTSPEWDEWCDVKDAFVPKTEAVWLSDYLVRDAVDFGRVHQGAIIWVEHTALGAAIAHAGGWRYYGGGEDAGIALETASGRETVVASVDAHGTGRNLQMFNTGLVCTPSSSEKRWEQLLGRTHRSGQQAPVVANWIYQHTPELRSALVKARESAAATEQAGGGAQKLQYATYSFDVVSPNPSVVET